MLPLPCLIYCQRLMQPYFLFPESFYVLFFVVLVFNLLEPGNISRALCGDQVGTLIDQTGKIT